MKNRSCDFYFDPGFENYIIEYKGNFKEKIDKISYACGDIINSTLGIIAVRSSDLSRLLNDVPEIIFVDFRTMFVLQDISPSSVDNINTIKINPYLNLTGKNVLVGIVDTGIDYLNEEFIREDDTSRIINIWDQSIKESSNTDNSIYIGETYSNEQINKAITAYRNKEDPYKIVPSKDEVGHGTKAAAIIGARGYNPEFKGIANNCEFIVVKLFESTNYKKMLVDNRIKPVPVYNLSEVLSAIEYIKQFAIKSRKPTVIYLGVGSTEGSHDGMNLISRYVSSIASIRGIALITGVGNEGDSQGHVVGYIKNVNDVKTVELKIPKELKYFSFKIWIKKPNRASLTVISPTGESSKLIQSKIDKIQVIDFVFVDTSMTVRYYTPEYYTGHELIDVTFNNIKSGIWKFSLLGEYITDGRFDIWLPPKITLPENTIFLEPSPLNTLTIPSTAFNTVTVAYYGSNNTLVASSGKGFNTNNAINPDIATIGINILTTQVGGGTSLLSGSSAATAIITGACALLFEWAIVNENDITMYSKKLRSYFMHGASRSKAFVFPNEEIGYGSFDLLGIFDFISRSYTMSRNKFNNFIEYYINNLFIRIPKELMEDFYEKKF
ncbi:S8 family peptidase [Clostridium taeniosporum]|uniref:Peptidase S8 and S53 subtilisin kexin sedolisin n=1 Tax=Clostridium taeniosporum TaxID=394958 RepID=A0A1D7XJT7_9CLOT|nr:S8 family peptidase [Clostridium taeniosporum]AOR23595.1 peptidase S8 and S53 subtilisin kexin sedolisin [Clostridium taeniosporum]